MSDRGHLSLSSPVESRPDPDRGPGTLMVRRDENQDFGVRNTLLYFRDLKQATLDLSPGSAAAPAAVGRLLSSHRVSLSELFDNDPDAFRAATKRVRAISYRAQRTVDKGAEATLGIAWGMATWENGRPATPAAPIVLREASVARRAGAGEDFYLAVEGGWGLNMTLLHLLEVDFGVDVELGALTDLVEELADHGHPDALFERVAKIAADVPGFVIVPRVVLGTVPRVPMIGGPRIAPLALEQNPSEDADADVPSEPESEEAVMTRTIDLFRTGMLNPGRLPEESDERRVLLQYGPDAIIAEITAVLRSDAWPEPLVEHAHSGLRVRDPAELLQRWFDASDQRPRPSHWDATHFALWGLTAAPTAGDPAIRSVAEWGERRFHPVLVAWQVVAEQRSREHPGRRGHKFVPTPRRNVPVPRGLDQALWGLPVDLLVEWAAWVFRQWPGAAIEFLLPTGSPELVSSWYERARPVAELAVKTWIPFAAVEDDLGKAAQRWVKHLTVACAGGGAPLATWFEKSTEAAAEAVALRLGDKSASGPLRGRRLRGRTPTARAGHAI